MTWHVKFGEATSFLTLEVDNLFHDNVPPRHQWLAQSFAQHQPIGVAK